MYKITAKLMGGLCNYMFQIAAVYHFSKKYNLEPIISDKGCVKVHSSIETYKDNLFKNIKFNPLNTQFRVLNENGFGYQDIKMPTSNVCLNGYFQSYKYLENINCNKIFDVSIESYQTLKEDYQDLLDKNTCSIHVRRGDYLKSPNHHPVKSINYYMKAVKQMPKDSIFLIFSDDIQWCKNNFPNIPEKFIFIEGNKDFEDFILMANCKNNIICNSTFSWWAAWLNTHKEKKVIIPSQWFGPAYSNYNTEGFYYNNFVKI